MFVSWIIGLIVFIISLNVFICLMFDIFCIDVVGLFNGVGTERQYERNGLPTKMNVIELESEGY